MSDLADSQKQIITGMYPVVLVGLAVQATVATVTGSVSGVEFGREFYKSQVVSLQTAHSWANAGVLLGDACIGSGVAFEAI